MIKSKKATIGSTLTWVVATFIILLIMVLYFIFLGITVLNKASISNAVYAVRDSKLLAVEELEYLLLNKFNGVVTIIDTFENTGISDSLKTFLIQKYAPADYKGGTGTILGRDYRAP